MSLRTYLTFMSKGSMALNKGKEVNFDYSTNLKPVEKDTSVSGIELSKSQNIKATTSSKHRKHFGKSPTSSHPVIYAFQNRMLVSFVPYKTSPERLSVQEAKKSACAQGTLCMSNQARECWPSEHSTFCAGGDWWRDR